MEFQTDKKAASIVIVTTGLLFIGDFKLNYKLHIVVH